MLLLHQLLSVPTLTTFSLSTGGIFAKDWLYVARTDKKNQLEILFKVGLGRVVVKDRLGAVLAKSKADFTFAPATPYQVVVNYDGTNVDITINGTPVIVDFRASQIFAIGKHWSGSEKRLVVD